MPRSRAALKRILIGRPRSSGELHRQLLPRWMALPLLSSNPLSSVAYATQEMMLVLVLAGAGALALTGPLSLAVVALLVIVVWSYRQILRAYPHGGAYIVARENLGDAPGLIAAAALLIDYTLTVAVSIAAGVAAIVSLLPELADQRVLLALGLAALVTVANLRGTREARLWFALPTYLFIVSIIGLIVVGVARCALATCPEAPSAGPEVPVEHALGVWLVLRAFASGAAALTGVETISSGVTAFRYPQARNAASTIAIIGGLAVVMFTGVTYLAWATGVVATPGTEPTVVAQVTLAVFGEGPAFYLVQLATAAVLVLAATTVYADFPRLSSVLARDRWFPRQFLSQGDPLAFSNGILLLGAAAGGLLIVYRASVTELVHLYVLAVFTSLTLSLAGMARHWIARRERGWKHSAAINTVGALVTAVVVLVVGTTRFLRGVWLVLIAGAILIVLMHLVRRHYTAMSLALRTDLTADEPQRPHHAVLVLDRVDEATARALSYAMAANTAGIRALGLPQPGADLERRWAELAGDIPLEILAPATAPGAVDSAMQALRAEAARHPEAFTSAVIPEALAYSWWDQLRRHRLAMRLKSRLLHEELLVATDITSPPGGPGPYVLEEPAEHHVVVLVSAVNRAALRALRYAEGLRPTSLQAVSINLDADRSTRILSEWESSGVGIPIELVDSPFRNLSATLRSYVRSFYPDGRYTVVTCVLPDFVLPHWYLRPLHNQTAEHIKGALLFERGVVTTSVSYLVTEERLGRSLDQRRLQAGGAAGV